VPLSKGKFLVATERMGDPRFAEAVILLVEHGRNGAVGLIINRPTERNLSEVLPDLDAAAAPDRTVYLGGPVDVTRLTILIQSDEEPPESVLVFNDVHVTGSRKALEQLLSGEARFRVFRIYAGYAGWGPQQLEREVGAGGWHVTEADVASVFLKQSSQVWPDLMRQISVLWVLGKGDGPHTMTARTLLP
jgi:putative transcriptional regulator